MKYLTEDQIIKIHDLIIDTIGGSHGILNKANINSSLVSPLHKFTESTPFGESILYSYDTILKRIVKLSHSLIKNHCFIDGNKRVGVCVLLLLLKLNGYKMKYSQKELTEIILSIANSNLSFDSYYNWIEERVYVKE